MPFGNLTIDEPQTSNTTPVIAVAAVTNPSVSTALVSQEAIVQVHTVVAVNGTPNFPPLSISESDGEWTFTVDYDMVANQFAGCGPIDSEGQQVGWGVCVVYAWNDNEQSIRNQLQALMEGGHESVAQQEQYAQDLAAWEDAKQQCESQSEEGYTFGYVNEDGTSTGYPDTSSFVCMRTEVAATGASGSGGAGGGTTQEDEETLDEEEDETHVAGGSIELGFSEGMKETLKNGLILIAVLGIGYGAYQAEKKTDLFSNTYKKLTDKLKKSKATKKPPHSQQT